MIRTILLSCTLLAATVAQAEETSNVYRWVDDSGVVNFSNVDSDKGEKIEILETMKIPSIKWSMAADEDSIILEKKMNPKLSISSPIDQSAFYSTQGNVNIKIDNDQPIPEDMNLIVRLDDRIVGAKNATNIELSNVNRGTHTVSVELVNKDGESVSKSSSVFTLHRATVYRN